jgi:hypothetical protein
LGIKRSRVLLALVFVAAGFVVLEVFRALVGFGSPDRVMVWVWIVFAASMFGLGISVILDLGKKKTLALFSLMLLMGAVFFFPVPQDLLPIVGVAWYGLLMFILWLFVKHFKLDKRSAGNGSVVELQETKQ